MAFWGCQRSDSLREPRLLLWDQNIPEQPQGCPGAQQELGILPCPWGCCWLQPELISGLIKCCLSCSP